MSDGGEFRTAPVTTAVVGRRGLPLASRIAAIVAVVLLAAFGGALTIAYPFVQGSSQDQARSELREQATAVGRFLEAAKNEALINGTTFLVPSQIVAILQQSHVEIAIVSQVGQYPQPVLASDFANGGRRRAVSDVRTVDGASMFYEFRALGDGYALVLLQPAAVASGATKALVFRMGYGALVSLILAMAAVVFYTRRTTQPITHAVEAARRMAAGARDVRLLEGGVAEIADLSHSMNALSDALAASEDRQRRFLLSVSHELRTPLTALSGYAEAMADNMIEPDDIEHVGTVMSDEAARLQRLVSDLLDLSRAGAVELRFDPAPVELGELLAGAGHVWHDRCAREEVVFRLDVPPTPCTITTDATRLRQCIDNLAENALRVTPAGRPVVIAARWDDTDVTIEVRDGGPGLSDDDIAVAFEPAELHNRYRGIRAVGTGVGLALVGRLAERLGGRAYAQHAPEGGALFGLRLPRDWHEVPTG